MMLPCHKLQYFIAGVLVFGLVGCGNQHFRGNLSIDGVSGVDTLQDQPVQIELNLNTFGSKAVAHIKTLKGQTILRSLNIEKINANHYDLVIPDLRRRMIHLKKIAKDPSCFVGTELYLTEFCHNDFSFTLTVKDKYSGVLKMKLYGAVASDSSPFKTESLASSTFSNEEGSFTFTIPEAIDRLFKRDFDIQESFQEFIRAKESANKNYLNLLPHPSLGSAIVMGLSVAKGVPKARRSLGDFVPFLFPTRWLKAKEPVWHSRVENISYTIAKSNSILALQIHALFFKTHLELRNELKELQIQIENSLESARQLQKEGYFDENSILTIQIALNDLNVSLRKADGHYCHDRFQISQLLGYQNPLAVEEVILGDETSRAKDIGVLESTELNLAMEKYAELAIVNSFELSQLYFLRKAAELNATDVFLNWFDVSGSRGLGLN